MASGIVEPSQSGGSQEQSAKQQQEQQGPTALARSRLVAKLMQHASNLPAFLYDILHTQAMLVAGTEAAAFALEPTGENQYRLKNLHHIRPDQSTDEVKTQALQAFGEIVGNCLKENKNGTIEIDGSNNGTDTQYCLVTHLRNENQIVASTAVIARCRNQEAARQRLQVMEIVAGYFDLWTLKRTNEQMREVSARHQNVFQYGSAVATSDGFKSGAMNLCNELAARTGAERVSIGWQKGNHIKLQAMSHTEQFDRKQELSVLIEKAMEECVDAEEIVQFDPAGESSQNVTRDAQQLSKINGGETVISIPLRHRGEIHGVLTLEFPPQRKLLPTEATSLAVAAELLSAQLYDRYMNDQWLIQKAGHSAREMGEKVVGPKHMVAKLIAIIVFGGLLFMCLYRPMYKVAAPFSFKAIDMRIVSAPFEGIIEKVYVRPGDSVTVGAPLLKLKTTELELQRNSALAQANAKRTEAEKYAADPSKQADRLAALKEADASFAQARLYQDRIDRSTVVAPVAGEVLTGDHREKEGAPVKVGDQLFEIGDTANLRCEIYVAERDIHEVREQQKGWIATTSNPGHTIAMHIDRIVPSGIVKDGGNVFRVDAVIDDPQSDFRPGMEGEARIEIDKRPLIWIWTHRLTDFLRLKLWM